MSIAAFASVLEVNSDAIQLKVSSFGVRSFSIKDNEKEFKISKHSFTDSSESFFVAHDPNPTFPSESSKVMKVFLIES